MAIPSWKLFPALVSGNTCVVKPATDTPLSTYNLVQTLMDAGLPPGVVNIVAGSGSAVGTPLIEHPDVRAISFTGSSAVGSLVGQRAAATFKPVSLEMGGKNAQIVMDDANLDLALDGALWGAFGTTGQRCTATSRILLQKGIQIETSAKYVEIAIGEGAKLLTGGHALTYGIYAHGTYFEPTVLGSVTPSMRVAREEVFGPVVSLIEFETFDEAIGIANSVDYGLSVALYTRDVNRAFAAIRDLEAGITYINAPTIGAEVHLPFGGVKHTGNGHREGNGAIDFFTTWKAVYVDYSDKLQRAQIDNAE
jgi:aldehyde dehydrogenase (NAD+)